MHGADLSFLLTSIHSLLHFAPLALPLPPLVALQFSAFTVLCLIWPTSVIGE